MATVLGILAAVTALIALRTAARIPRMLLSLQRSMNDISARVDSIAASRAAPPPDTARHYERDASAGKAVRRKAERPARDYHPEEGIEI